MTTQHDNTKRWRPLQFNLSTLLLLTVAVALAVGWWVDHQEIEGNVNALKMENDELLIDQAIDAMRHEARDDNEVIRILMDFKTERPDLYSDRLKRGIPDR